MTLSEPDLSRPTTVLLVRHGRTAATGGTFSGGDEPGPELDDRGRREAGSVADLLSGGVPFRRPEVVIHSGIVRARQTAETIATVLDVEPDVDPDWRELRFGEWHGLTAAQVAERWPQELRDWQLSTASAPPGGETLADHSKRAGGALDRLVAAYPGRTVAVVSHLAPVRAVITTALDAGPAALWRLRIDPCSVSVLRIWADGGTEVATVNTTTHLGYK